MPNATSKPSRLSSFQRLTAWRACHELTLAIYRQSDSWPETERYGLISQVRRAAVSCCCNIAEGSAKRGSAEFRRFLDMALGSLAEIEALFLIARDLGILQKTTWGELEAFRDHAGKLVWGLYLAVGRRTTPRPAKPRTEKG